MKSCKFQIYRESIALVTVELDAMHRNIDFYVAAASRTVLQQAIIDLGQRYKEGLDQSFLDPLTQKPREDRRGRRATIPAEGIDNLVDSLSTASGPMNMEKTVIHKLVHIHLEKTLNAGVEEQIRRILSQEAQK